MIDYKIVSIQTTDQSDRVKVKYRVYEGEKKERKEKDTATGKTATTTVYERSAVLIRDGEMVVHARGEKAIHEEVKKRLTAQLAVVYPTKEIIDECKYKE